MMTTLMQADIFFFVTTIAVGLLTIGIVVIMIYAIKILHDIRHMSGVARKEGNELVEEFALLRTKMRGKWPLLPVAWVLVRRIVRHYNK